MLWSIEVIFKFNPSFVSQKMTQIFFQVFFPCLHVTLAVWLQPQLTKRPDSQAMAGSWPIATRTGPFPPSARSLGGKILTNGPSQILGDQKAWPFFQHGLKPFNDSSHLTWYTFVSEPILERRCFDRVLFSVWPKFPMGDLKKGIGLAWSCPLAK